MVKPAIPSKRHVKVTLDAASLERIIRWYLFVQKNGAQHRGDLTLAAQLDVQLGRLQE